MMNEHQKQRLERNLSESAAGAKVYWVRALTGSSPEKQAYIDPRLLPLTSKENLGQFHEDFNHTKNIYDKQFKDVEEHINRLQKLIEVLESENENLKKRIQDLEGFGLD